jgi:hypothetical protein
MTLTYSVSPIVLTPLVGCAFAVKISAYDENFRCMMFMGKVALDDEQQKNSCRLKSIIHAPTLRSPVAC